MEIYRQRTHRFLVKSTVILVIIALGILAYPYQKRELAIVERTIQTQEAIVVHATQTQEAMYATQTREIIIASYTPTPTPTNSPTPTSTSTPTMTPTPSVTPSPTNTPLPTPIPCLTTAQNDGEGNAPTIYDQPSSGRTLNSTTLHSGDEINLYRKLKYEPWWLVSRGSRNMPEGWLHEGFVQNADDCQIDLGGGLPLSTLQDSPKSVDIYVEETFSTLDYEWQFVDGSKPSTRGGTLHIPDGRLYVAQLTNQSIPDTVDLRTSLNRDSGGTDSYVAIRFLSREISNSYFEVRFHRNLCTYSYHLFIEDNEVNSPEPIQLGNEARCDSVNEVFITLLLASGEEANNLSLSGTYNDEVLIPFPILDEYNLFNEINIAFVADNTDTRVDYLLVTQP